VEDIERGTEMSIFMHILGNNVIPIFILIALGFALNKKFNLNILTLSKLNFYFFIPGFIFYNLYTTDLNLNMLKIIFFCILYLIATDILSRIIAKIRRYDAGLSSAFKNSIMFNNTGNIGLALVSLVFSSEPFVINGQTPYLNQALAAQIMVMVFMNLSINTLGFYNAGRAKKSFKDSISQAFAMPSIYIITLVLLLKYIKFDITTTPIWPVIINIKGGMVSISLLTLGVQLSKTKFDFKNANVHIAVFTRLILGPVLALIFIYLFGFYGVIAQILLISYSLPTAVNTALIAVEYDNNQDFASQEVMVSTIFSCITLTLTIYLARVLFPVA
jgi:malate permease and related proteins